MIRTNAFILLIFLSIQLKAQNNTLVKESSLNKDLPGAQYKFSFVHLTDIHIGEGQGDYGTPGFLNDTMPEGDAGFTAVRLRHAVNWINANAAEKGIRFVVVTGDITDSAERSEFEKAKEILNTLNIPYVPTIGNHDIWPYVRYQFEAPYAYGDSVMYEIFSDVYDRAKQFFDRWDDGTRLKRVFNPESGLEHYHQNFMFEYQGFAFFCFDFNPRYHVRKEEPGIGPEARLNDFVGGTFEYMTNSLKEYPNKGIHNIFFLTHHPPHRDPISIVNGLPFQQYDKMTKALLPYRDHLAYWLAGHVHRNRDYNVGTWLGSQKVMEARETTANMEFEKGHFRIIHVYEAPRVTAVIDRTLEVNIQIEPNPNNGFVRVRLPESPEPYTLSLYDLSGKVVMQPFMLNPNQNVAEVRMEGLPPAQYLLQVEQGYKTAAKPLIKL
jgi:hypothetical protein